MQSLLLCLSIAQREARMHMCKGCKKNRHTRTRNSRTCKHRTDFFMPSTSSATTTFSEAAAASKRHEDMQNEESTSKAMKDTQTQASMDMYSQEAARNAWLSKRLLQRKKRNEASQRQRKKDALTRECSKRSQHEMKQVACAHAQEKAVAKPVRIDWQDLRCQKRS